MNRILLCMTLLLASQCAFAFSYTVELTEQALQQKVSAMMPMKKKRLFVTIILSDPQVTLSQDSNKIGIFTHVTAMMPGGIQGSGRAKIKGSLSYNTDTGAFHFHDPIIEKLEVDDVPEKFTAKVKQLAQLAMTKAMTIYPIYKFKDNNLKHKLAKAALESIEVKNKTLYVTLSAF
ncbi:DUF1439 domain-containing protein [Algibacillus agarilyticus]|uniref:DUF1439 domain-containing protein n=1 Tax=Algibacillus agarilyticus TaxID=2234133 RepID=UPI000DD0BCA0|nr:DUF1439 domain-containing protein [Algibacillus agarilyticus]